MAKDLTLKLTRQKWKLVVRSLTRVPRSHYLQYIEHLVKITDALLFDILLGSYHQTASVYFLQIAALTSSLLVSL